MTSTDSTSRPSSQTARTKRSTSTLVLPVPAPAETKTSPVASTAARCCGFTSRPLDPAHRPEVAPGWARAATRVVPHVTGADAIREAASPLPRRLDQRPEVLVVDVVVLLEARQVVDRAALQQAAADACAGESPIQAAER